MPVAKEQIRQIIADNNICSVADVYLLAAASSLVPSMNTVSFDNSPSFPRRRPSGERGLHRQQKGTLRGTGQWCCGQEPSVRPGAT